MTISIRLAESADIEDLARINIAAWRSAYTGIVPDAVLDGMTFERYRERWRRILAPDNPRAVTVLVGAVDGRLTSYVVFGAYRPQQDAPPDEDTSGWAEILAIYTDPDRQGRGVGSALLEAALAQLVDLDCGHGLAALWVLQANRKGRSWYERRGWRPDGALSMWDAEGTSLPEIRMVRALV